MEDYLNVSLIQFDTVWENKLANMEKLESLFSQSTIKNNWVILPEMFLTGFSMKSNKIAETMEGEMVSWMKTMAQKFQITLMGSLPILEGKSYFNRLIICESDGKLFWYDKKHLFRMGEELYNYSPGNKRVIYNYGTWKALPLVCYDLRFPVWSRNKNLEYDILIYVTNWPGVRNDAYLTLLKARAIENSAYVIGVNRIGIDGLNISYLGNSVVFNPKGQVIAGLIENSEQIIQAQISYQNLKTYRDKFPSHLDADNFTLIA